MWLLDLVYYFYPDFSAMRLYIGVVRFAEEHFSTRTVLILMAMFPLSCTVYSYLKARGYTLSALWALLKKAHKDERLSRQAI